MTHPLRRLRLTGLVSLPGKFQANRAKMAIQYRERERAWRN